MEGLVAMSVLKGPRCHQPQCHNGVGAASEGCLGMDGDIIMRMAGGGLSLRAEALSPSPEPG